MKSSQHAHDYKVNYIKGIDGLRALAVLAVLLFHINPFFLPGGYTGVDIFFVISGYVVSSSLYKSVTLNFLNFTFNFYAKRCLRILPALVLCLSVTTVFVTLYIPSAWLSHTFKNTGLSAFLGISNLMLAWDANNYYSPSSDFNPFIHTWSLGVEEQFYLIFPFIFYLGVKFKSHGKVIALILGTLLFTFFLISLVFAGYEVNNDPLNGFYLLPSRFWELASGALLFKLHSRRQAIPTSFLSVHIFFVMGALLVIAAFIFSKEGYLASILFTVIGTLFLISGFIHSFGVKSYIQKIFEHPLTVYIGKISYSLYLWHWPIFVLFRWTIGLESIENIILALILAIAFSAGSYHLVEIPISKNSYLNKFQKWEVITIGISFITIAFITSLIIFESKERLNQSVTRNKVIWQPLGWSSQNKKVDSKLLKGKKLFVIGDSHASAYTTMIQKLSDEYDVETKIFSEPYCGIVNFLKPILKCSKTVDYILKMIERDISSGDIVFLASLRMNRLGDQWGAFTEENTSLNQKSYKAIENKKLANIESLKIIERIHRLGIHIIIDAPMPIFKSPAFRCSDWFNAKNPQCIGGLEISKKFILMHRVPVMQALTNLKKQFPETNIWDPLPRLCNSTTCKVFDDSGKPLFFDGDHLSAHGNRVLYPYFLKVIKSIWLAKEGNISNVLKKGSLN